MTSLAVALIMMAQATGSDPEPRPLPQIHVPNPTTATVQGGKLVIEPVTYSDRDGNPIPPPERQTLCRNIVTVSEGDKLPRFEDMDYAVAWDIHEPYAHDHRNFFAGWPNGTSLWRRPNDAMPVWEWEPDNPDDPKPREGSWRQVNEGYHTPLPDLDYPGRVMIDWWNESSNNWTFNQRVTIVSEGPVTVIVRGVKQGTEVIQWGGKPDLNMDGKVNFHDQTDFQNAFAREDMAADYDGNGVLDFFDFLAFQNAFEHSTKDWYVSQFTEPPKWLPRVFAPGAWGPDSEPIPGPGWVPNI